MKPDSVKALSENFSGIVTNVFNYFVILFFNVWFWLGLFCLVIGIYHYYYKTIWKSVSQSPKYTKSFVKNIPNIISFIPSKKSSPWDHVKGGIFSSLGLCLFFAAIITTFFNGMNNIDIHSFELTIAGLIFAILISFITFWTFWQTKQIDHKLGYNINGFKNLVQELTQRLNKLNEDFTNTHKHHAHKFHRVYFMTTNPFFGMLSENLAEERDPFQKALQLMALNVSYSKNGILNNNSKQEFIFKVACGNKFALDKFHRDFYGSDIETANKKTNETLALMEQMESLAGRQIFYKLNVVPDTQFMIISNDLYEWILEANPNQQLSDVFSTGVKEEDQRICDRFKNTFEKIIELSQTVSTNVLPDYLGYDSRELLNYGVDISKTIPGEKEVFDKINEVIKVYNKKNLQILELGMGVGVVANKLIPTNDISNYLGMDFDPNMIKTAANNLKQFNPQIITKEQSLDPKTPKTNMNLRLLEADFNQLEFPNDNDFVLAIISLHHQIDIDIKKELYKKIYNSLKPGGIFLFADLVTTKDIKKAALQNVKHYHFLVEQNQDEEWLSKWAFHHQYLNRPLPIEDELDYLTFAKFKKADILFQKFNTVLVKAVK
ncbi:MAG: class I SAM-dependent methyltransferase [Melioribacter sp.]|nr:class I SAM-dependent methyltransferase [Melioribacter sp.]